jgi:hypothetical protein
VSRLVEARAVTSSTIYVLLMLHMTINITSMISPPLGQ